MSLARLPQESPFTIMLNDEELLTLMATPEKLQELAAGFLITSGIIHQAAAIAEIVVKADEGIIWVQADVRDTSQQLLAQHILASGCGGALIPKSAMSRLPKIISPLTVQQEDLHRLFKSLLSQATLYRRSGGIHGSALGERGKLLFLAEDVGRHNTVDKIVGWAALTGVDMKDKFLVTTGRISSEMVIKTARSGLPVVASRTSPTDLAVRLARQVGLTVIGYLKSNSLKVYTHKWRIIQSQPQSQLQS